MNRERAYMNCQVFPVPDMILVGKKRPDIPFSKPIFSPSRQNPYPF